MVAQDTIKPLKPQDIEEAFRLETEGKLDFIHMSSNNPIFVYLYN